MEKFKFHDNQYKCIFCNIKITLKSNIHKHLNTVAHKDNEKKFYWCLHCKFATEKSELFKKHLLTKGHAKNNLIKKETIYSPVETKPKQEFELNSEALLHNIFELKQEIKELKQQNEMRLDEMNKYKITRKDIKDIVKEGVDDSKLAKNTSALLCKLNSDYSTNPPLLHLNDVTSQLLLSKQFNAKKTPDINAVEKSLILSYHNKKIVEDLSNLIMSEIKHDDKSKQAVFVSDISRLTYFIKLNVKEWLNDKKGIAFAERVIKPLLNTIKIRIEEFYFSFNKKKDELDEDEDDDYKFENYVSYEDDFNFYVKYNDTIKKLIKEIISGSLCKSILTKVSPYLQFNDLVLC